VRNRFNLRVSLTCGDSLYSVKARSPACRVSAPTLCCSYAGGCNWRLIDLDAATPIGEVVGTKWSTAYNPPEILYRVPTSLLAKAGAADYGEDGTVRRGGTRECARPHATGMELK
jgi:hypothetical protein